jgi:hypothetical protein
LVYYRGLGSRYDQLVGYVYLQPNKRRLWFNYPHSCRRLNLPIQNCG